MAPNLILDMKNIYLFKYCTMKINSCTMNTFASITTDYWSVKNYHKRTLEPSGPLIWGASSFWLISNQSPFKFEQPLRYMFKQNVFKWKDTKEKQKYRDNNLVLSIRFSWALRPFAFFSFGSMEGHLQSFIYNHWKFKPRS